MCSEKLHPMKKYEIEEQHINDVKAALYRGDSLVDVYRQLQRQGVVPRRAEKYRRKAVEGVKEELGPLVKQELVSGSVDTARSKYAHVTERILEEVIEMQQEIIHLEQKKLVSKMVRRGAGQKEIADSVETRFITDEQVKKYTSQENAKGVRNTSGYRMIRIFFGVFLLFRTLNSSYNAAIIMLGVIVSLYLIITAMIGDTSDS